ncbi:FIST N-terminal domain-containing protein [Leptothrix sp. BB-4]
MSQTPHSPEAPGADEATRLKPGIRLGHVAATDAAEAVRLFHAEVAQPDAALVLFSCTPDLDTAVVAAEMARRFGDTLVVGCTSAGEFGPLGYATGTLAGFSLPAADFSVVSRCLEPLAAFEPVHGRLAVQEMLQALERDDPHGLAAEPGFALLLVDGLSGAEERLTRMLQTALGSIPLVGGSAADGRAYGRTEICAGGRFASDRAVLLLVRSRWPVQAVMTQHFMPGDRRAVVTSADAPNRIVHEIDGLPAAQAYAQLVDVPVEALDSARFAAAPVAVMIGGLTHMRSISKALPGGSLKFHCAIDEGIVLRVTRSVDLLGKLERSFETLAERLGGLQLVIGFDCILRRLEIEQTDLADGVGELMRRHRVVGFNTYGEQFRGVHVNQTFTGVAIGGAGHA